MTPRVFYTRQWHTAFPIVRPRRRINAFHIIPPTRFFHGFSLSLSSFPLLHRYTVGTLCSPSPCYGICHFSVTSMFYLYSIFHVQTFLPVRLPVTARSIDRYVSLDSLVDDILSLLLLLLCHGLLPDKRTVPGNSSSLLSLYTH